jgi:hypothetical protein
VTPLLLTAGGILLFVFTSVVVKLVVDESVGMVTGLSRAIVRTAVSRLPVITRARYEEEWLAELAAFGGSPSQWSVLRDPPRRDRGTNQGRAQRLLRS